MQLSSDPLDDLLIYLTSEESPTSEEQKIMNRLSVDISVNEDSSQIVDMQQALDGHIEAEHSAFYKQRLTEHQKTNPAIEKKIKSTRRLANSRLAHLGLLSFETFKTQQIKVVESGTASWIRDIRSLDKKNSRETIKVALLYVARGAEDEATIFKSCLPSQDYREFVAGLGWEVSFFSGAS